MISLDSSLVAASGDNAFYVEAGTLSYGSGADVSWNEVGIPGTAVQ